MNTFPCISPYIEKFGFCFLNSLDIWHMSLYTLLLSLSHVVIFHSLKHFHGNITIVAIYWLLVISQALYKHIALNLHNIPLGSYCYNPKFLSEKTRLSNLYKVSQDFTFCALIMYCLDNIICFIPCCYK